MLRRPNATRPTTPNHPDHSAHLDILFQSLMYRMIERLIPNLNVPSNTFGVVPKGIVSVSGDKGESVAEVQGILPGHVSGGIEASLAV